MTAAELNSQQYSKYYGRLLPKGYVKPSYWHEPSTLPLLPFTVGQLIDYAAETWGDEEAFVSLHENVRMTFRDVRDKVDEIAAGLLELGFNPGDILAVWGSNSTGFYVSSLAGRRVGLIVAGIDPCAQTPELLHCLTKVGAKGIVAVELNEKQKYYEMLRSLAPELSTSDPGKLHSKQLPKLRVVTIASSQSYKGTYKLEDIPKLANPTNSDRVRSLQNSIQCDDATSIFFTSGTTGKWKGVLHNHHSLLNNVHTFGKLLQFDLEKHKVLVQMQICSAGCSGMVCMGLLFGSSIVFSSGEFDVKSSLEALQNERCTVIFGAPTIYVDIVSVVKEKKRKLDYPKLAITIGAPVTGRLIEEVTKVLPVEHFNISYGMTECNMATCNPLGDPVESLSTVGRVIGNVEIKVVDTDGKMVPMGTPGELWVRGYNVMKCYWDDEEKTAETLTLDGWLKTGDRFILEEGGYCKIVGRNKEIIIREGFNIYPKEIENFLHSHPSMRDVCAFGVPDARMGEEMCVYIKVNEGETLTENSVKSYCVGKLADFKIPRYVRFIDEFPKNTTGKIHKRKLLEMFKKDEEYIQSNKSVSDKLYEQT